MLRALYDWTMRQASGAQAPRALAVVSFTESSFFPIPPDVLLVPMLAFDRQGYRLGYGGGFYDRTLEKLRAFKKVWAVGVAYAAQEVDAVPRGAHDAPLDYVMTEQEIFACG